MYQGGGPPAGSSPPLDGHPVPFGPGGYRGGGPVDAALPLPRRWLVAWLVVHVLVALIVLVGPVLAVAVGKPGSVFRAMQEGGVPAYLIVGLHPILTILSAVLGILAVRGKRIPLAALVGLAVAPVMIGLAGCAIYKSKIVGAVMGESIDPSQKLRIMAEGFSELDTLYVHGALAGGALLFLAAFAAIGSVLSVDPSRVSPPAPARPAVLGGIGAGAAVVVLALVGLRFLRPASPGGVEATLALVFLAAGAAAAGPLVTRLGALAAASHTEGDLRRARANAALPALILPLAVFFLDRATFALSESRVLGAISGYSVDASLRGEAFARFGAAMAAASRASLVETSAAVVLLATALVLALRRRPAWGTRGATTGIVLAVVLTQAGYALSRAGTLSSVGDEAARRDAAYPAELPAVARRVATRSDTVDVTIDVSGNVNELHRGGAAKKGLLPDVRTPVRTILEASARINERPEAIFGLAGRPASGTTVAAAASLPAELRRLISPEVAIYSNVRFLRALPPGTDLDISRPILVLPTARDAITVQCESATTIVGRSVSLADPLEARRVVTDLLRPCTSRGIMIAPLPDAVAGDVYAALAAFPEPGSDDAEQIFVSGAREPIEAYLKARPPGPRPVPGLGGLGLGGPGGVLRPGAAKVTGRLPPEVIQRIVRQNLGRFRLCYENGLRQNPKLTGQVTVRFTIDRAGAVSSAKDERSDLPDAGVVACVVRAYGSLSFPAPEGGSVSVVYPMSFSPAGKG